MRSFKSSRPTKRCRLKCSFLTATVIFLFLELHGEYNLEKNFYLKKKEGRQDNLRQIKRLAHFISISLWRTKQSGLEVAFKQLRPDTSLGYPFEMSAFKFNYIVFFFILLFRCLPLFTGFVAFLLRLVSFDSN